MAGCDGGARRMTPTLALPRRKPTDRGGDARTRSCPPFLQTGQTARPPLSAGFADGRGDAHLLPPLSAGFADGGGLGRGSLLTLEPTMQTHEHPHWRASKAMQARARELRRAMTPAERKLWQYIRYGQLGVQFRRQHAVGPYIVDFFCAKSKLVVEIDGDSHADPEQAEYDAIRTEWLNAQKHFRVIRFWNNDVLRNIEAVLAKICENLATGD